MARIPSLNDGPSRADSLSADVLQRYRSSTHNGRLIGQLSVITAPFALFADPTVFSLSAFALGLIGITIASKEQRHLSIFGVVTALACGIVGHGIQLL
jgi:hypothetical protein